jgi:hypothetical protein
MWHMAYRIGEGKKGGRWKGRFASTELLMTGRGHDTFYQWALFHVSPWELPELRLVAFQKA